MLTDIGKKLLVLSINANCYSQSCFVKNVLPSEDNDTQTNDQNQSRNSLANIIVSPNSI